jgi:transposase InsO family protein
VGFCYVAFVVDVYSRRIVGWCAATHLRTDLALAALDMAATLRDERLEGLVHHSDRGSQYTSIRYSERLEQFDITPSVGSGGDSYDNASRNRPSGFTSPSSSPAARGGRPRRSSGRPPPTSTGTTIDAFMGRVVTSRRRSSRAPTIATATPRRQLIPYRRSVVKRRTVVR